MKRPKSSLCVLMVVSPVIDLCNDCQGISPEVGPRITVPTDRSDGLVTMT
jgi:hypothetical protein